MKYFSIAELTASDEAKKKGIQNVVDAAITSRLTGAIEGMFDSVRELYGKPIKVTSGYRCPTLNKAVGGSTSSAHLTGYAADTQPKDGNMAAYQKAVLKWAETHQFDQIIIEYPNSKNLAKWIHLGWKNNQGKQRKQILYTLNGREYYTVYKGSKFYKV